MHKLRRVDPADREKLKVLFPIEKIYLYGSVARGEIHEDSDIDLIIVGDFKERFFERIGLISELPELPIEPLVYTQEEFKALQEEGNPLIKEALCSGVEL